MDQTTYAMLDIMEQPVFLMNRFSVFWMNSAAQHLFPGGVPKVNIFQDHMELLTNLKEDNPVALELMVDGMLFHAKAKRFSEVVMVVLRERKDPNRDMPPAILEMVRGMGSVSQELLVAIEGIMDFIAEECEDYPPEASSLNRCSYRIQRLILQSRDIGKIMENDLFFNKSAISLRFFTEAFEDRVLDIVRKAGWDFRIEFADKDCIMYMDVILVRRALYITLLNSLRHTPKGGTIVLTVGCTKDRAMFCFKDNDIDASQYFYLDDQMGNTLNTSRELQLGHIFIREIARAHNGTFICSTDSSGKGLTTIMTIPRPTRLVSVSPRVEMDIYGGRDSTLVELSEVLDKSFYHPDRV